MFYKIIILAFVATSAATPIVSEIKDGRINGGVQVTLGQVPFMASLRSFGTNVHFCGGSILTNRYILTAGQCTYRKALTSINVVVGTITLVGGGVTHRSSNIIQHPSYDPLTLSNDISLIYVATNIVFNANVQTIGIHPTILGGNVFAQVSGWGSNLQTGGVSPNVLQRLNTTSISLNDCRSRHSPQNIARLSDNKLCTLTRSAEGTCFGDEGGALIADGQIVGVASWQVPCATGFPDVYEGVASKRLWILTVIGY